MKVKKFVFTIMITAILLSGCMSDTPEIVLETTEQSQTTQQQKITEDKTTDKTSEEEKTEDAVSDVSEKKPIESGNGQSTSKGKTDSADTIFVYVCGAVVNPGVYEMHTHDRIYQLIEQAGGLLETADVKAVNQAQELMDGQQVTIYTEEEVRNGQAGSQTPNQAPDGTDTAVTKSSNTGAAGGLVNINTADADTLMTLNGVGEAKAAAIVSYREEQGLFTKIEDIMNVNGIAEGLFSKIKEQITVD
ncbi:MAG: ComEA family DNA-binding protein [Lachnospiraceae bacterium]|nr:ComEA family DNA-binding protein [Lachnospiraceae bacterium]MDD3616298.1 ComEA family DNA-binding protein [Lachnospiraceae bacterium]